FDPADERMEGHLPQFRRTLEDKALDTLCLQEMLKQAGLAEPGLADQQASRTRTVQPGLAQPVQLALPAAEEADAPPGAAVRLPADMEDVEVAIRRTALQPAGEVDRDRLAQ